MTPIKQLQVANYCYALVSGMFAEFHNPTMRGAKFTWAKFPELVERAARFQVCTGFIITKTAKAEIEDEVAELAKEIATTLIERAGYV